MRTVPITCLLAVRLLCLTSVTLIFLVIQSSSSYAANKLYKWIDENGQIRYSDRLPASQSSKRFQTLAPDGRVVGTKEKSKSPEEIRQERAEKKRLEEEARIKAEKEANIRAEKKHNDDVLMLTFSNEAEILEAKKERMDVIESVIRLLRKDIFLEEEKLKILRMKAQNNYSSQDKKVPGGLAQNIEYSNAKINAKYDLLLVKNNERKKINQQYEEDLIRYRELSAQKKAEAAENSK